MISAITFIHWPEDMEVLEGCLKSLSFADEIIVINNNAPEEVVNLAKKYTKKIYPDNSDDFSAHHNLGKEKAPGDWLLYVDADERVSQKLQKEITEAVKSSEFSAFELRRVNYYLGKEAVFGDRYPDYVTRLFKKEKLRGWEGAIHESSKVEGKTGKLEAPMYHLTHRDIRSMVNKTLNFSEHEADLRLEANHPPVVWWRLIRVAVTEAWNRIFKMQGYRQGTEGWIDGMLQAFSMFIVYARLWEKQRRPALDETYREIDKKILSGEL